MWVILKFNSGILFVHQITCDNIWKSTFVVKCCSLNCARPVIWVFHRNAKRKICLASCLTNRQTYNFHCCCFLGWRIALRVEHSDLTSSLVTLLLFLDYKHWCADLNLGRKVKKVGEEQTPIHPMSPKKTCLINQIAGKITIKSLKYSWGKIYLCNSDI